MGKRLIIPGADFSQNSIEQNPIPPEIEYGWFYTEGSDYLSLIGNTSQVVGNRCFVHKEMMLAITGKQINAVKAFKCQGLEVTIGVSRGVLNSDTSVLNSNPLLNQQILATKQATQQEELLTFEPIVLNQGDALTLNNFVYYALGETLTTHFWDTNTISSYPASPGEKHNWFPFDVGMIEL